MCRSQFAWLAVLLWMSAVTACGESSAKMEVSADSETGRTPDVIDDTEQPSADAQTTDTRPAEVGEETLAPSDAGEEDADFGAEDGESGSGGNGSEGPRSAGAEAGGPPEDGPQALA